MKLKELTDYLDVFLNINNISDVALNGLQVEGGEEVEKIALAVDFCQEITKRAIENKCQMIICHHGMCWPAIKSVVGFTKNRVKTLLDNNISLYGVHLPLDKHTEVGNNAVLAKLLGADICGEFGIYSGQKIGLLARLSEPIRLDDFKSLFDKVLDTDSFLIRSEKGKEAVQNLGIISGGGAKEITDAASLELDIFVTGETSHSSFYTAKEGGTHLICGGHYKTETLGVKALGKHLEEKFGLKTVFFDLPTGL